MTTGNPQEHLSTTELVAQAFQLARTLSVESMDPLTVMTCRNLLFALARRFGSDGTDLLEPREVADAELAEAYARWAQARCAIERQRVLSIAARRVLGDGRRGRGGCAYFHRPSGSVEELREALDELQRRRLTARQSRIRS